MPITFLLDDSGRRIRTTISGSVTIDDVLAHVQALAAEQTAQLLRLVEQNNIMTELVRDLSQQIEALTREMHGKVVQRGASL